MRTTGGRPARAGLHGKRPRTRAVTAQRFIEMRQNCFVSQAEAAKALHVTERTVHNWESGATKVPYSAYKLLRILRGYALPGAAWSGWMLIGDTLYSPENHGFKATDANWWSLLVARARHMTVLAAENRQLRAAVDGLSASAMIPSTAPALLASVGSAGVESPATVEATSDRFAHRVNLTSDCHHFQYFSALWTGKKGSAAWAGAGPSSNTGQKSSGVSVGGAP